MADKIEIIKKLNNSIHSSLETFTGKTLKFIHGEYLSFAFETPKQFSSSKYCHFEFSNKYFIHIILLDFKNNFNKFCGYFPTFEIKVISKKKPDLKLKKMDEVNNFYKSLFKDESIFNPHSVISFKKHKQLILEQIIFFGYNEDTTFFSHTSEPPIEKSIYVNLVEGIIFRFKGNKEIVVRAKEDESFDINIFNEVDENRPSSYMHEIGWKTKTILSIGMDK